VNTGVPIVCKHGEGTAEPNANATVNDGPVESPVRGDAHAGFGDAGRGNGLVERLVPRPGSTPQPAPPAPQPRPGHAHTVGAW
jgi:hypothetical protein